MEEKNYIIIFDEKIAVELQNGGFSYMTETINQNQRVFVFEKTEELIMQFQKSVPIISDYAEVKHVTDDRLLF